MTKFANLHRNWRRNRNRNRNLFRNFGLRFRLNHGSRFDGILEQSRVDDLRRLKFKSGLKKHLKVTIKMRLIMDFFSLKRDEGSFQPPGWVRLFVLNEEKFSGASWRWVFLSSYWQSLLVLPNHRNYIRSFLQDAWDVSKLQIIIEDHSPLIKVKWVSIIFLSI